jgi:hypothetical protein
MKYVPLKHILRFTYHFDTSQTIWITFNWIPRASHFLSGSLNETKYLRQTESNECGDGVRRPQKEVKVERKQSSWPEAELAGTVTYSLMENAETSARLPCHQEPVLKLPSPEAHSEVLAALT